MSDGSYKQLEKAFIFCCNDGSPGSLSGVISLERDVITSCVFP